MCVKYRSSLLLNYTTLKHTSDDISTLHGSSLLLNYTTLKPQVTPTAAAFGSSLLLNYTTLKPQISRFKSIMFTKRSNLCFYYSISKLFFQYDLRIFFINIILFMIFIQQITIALIHIYYHFESITCHTRYFIL